VWFTGHEEEWENCYENGKEIVNSGKAFGIPTQLEFASREVLQVVVQKINRERWM